MTAATAPATPHCVHVVGIGRTGAAYVEALIRTGEVEDLLATPGARFAALLIDIGDEDTAVPGDYARSMKTRLASRGIPVDRYQYECVNLSLPDKAAFGASLEAARPLVKQAGSHDLLAALPKGFEMPKPGEHTPRAVARGLYAAEYFLGERRLHGALQRFAEHVKGGDAACTVFVAFGLAGGTGSGMAVDLARDLSALLAGSAAGVVGVGQLSHSGDGEYANSVAQTLAIEDIDQALKAGPGGPFAGGFFVVSSEQSWQRLSAYTKTGLKEVRQRFKQMVTNRFVADSFMRWAVSDGSVHLQRALQHGGGKCTLFDVAKLSHPGVQVLPGEAGSKWEAVLQQWIGFVPQYAGLSDAFKTDYAEVHVHAARDMQMDLIDAGLQSVVAARYLKAGACHSYRSEFFDELTAYGNVILPGATKDDLVAYRDAIGQIDAASRTMEQA